MSFPSLPPQFADDPELIAAHRGMAIGSIARTIEMAEIRCLPFDEFLTRIERLWEDAQAGAIVYRACTETFSDNQFYSLAE